MAGIFTLSDFARGQLNFGQSDVRTVSLGLNFTLGGKTFNSVNVHRQGFVTFGSPAARALAAPAATGTPGLRGLGDTVIAPFFAGLFPGGGSGSGVYVQQGQADLYPNGGRFSRADAQPTTVITWNNLLTPDRVNVTFQLLLGGQGDFSAARSGGGGSAFAFRYGTVSSPGLPEGANGTAGYAVDNFVYEYRGPFTSNDDFLSTFEATPGALGAVPEPGMWGMMITGFGIVGAWLRRRGRKVRPALA